MDRRGSSKKAVVDSMGEENLFEQMDMTFLCYIKKGSSCTSKFKKMNPKGKLLVFPKFAYGVKNTQKELIFGTPTCQLNLTRSPLYMKS